MPRRSLNWAAVLGWVGFCAWFLLLWFLSSQSPGDLPKWEFPHGDKVVHFVYFACGGAALAWSIAASFRLSRRDCFRLSVLVMTALGGFDEWRQTFTPGRQGADWWDFFADVAGAAAGIAIALWLYERVRRRLR